MTRADSGSFFLLSPFPLSLQMSTPPAPHSFDILDRFLQEQGFHSPPPLQPKDPNLVQAEASGEGVGEEDRGEDLQCSEDWSEDSDDGDSLADFIVSDSQAESEQRAAAEELAILAAMEEERFRNLEKRLSEEPRRRDSPRHPARRLVPKSLLELLDTVKP